MKQCQENPWLRFSENNSLGDVVNGKGQSQIRYVYWP